MKTEGINLNELIYLARQNDEEAFRLLYDSVLRLMLDVRQRSCAGVVSVSEWKTEILFLVEKAVYCYREKERADFRTLLVRMGRNRAIELLRSARRGLGPYSGLVAPLEEIIEGTPVSIEDLGRVPPGPLISERIVADVACQQICSRLAPYLKPRQLEILELCRQGQSRDQIAQKFGIQRRTVQRALDTAAYVYAQLEKYLAQGRSEPFPIQSRLPSRRRDQAS